MRVLYAARYARFDLLRAVARLASYVAFWDRECDKRMIKLFGYIKESVKYKQFGWVGDSLIDVAPFTYSDADFAGCSRTLRSTSGIQINIEGPKTCFPITARSLRQPLVAYSTPEAEVVALNLAARTLTLPAIDLWEVLLPPGFWSRFMEDNQATIQILKTGRNPTLRYLGRSQGICIQQLYELLTVYAARNRIELEYLDTELMVADIHTKAFTAKEKWSHAIFLINVLRLQDHDSRIKSHHEKFVSLVPKPKINMPGGRTIQ